MQSVQSPVDGINGCYIASTIEYDMGYHICWLVIKFMFINITYAPIGLTNEFDPY
jgi:hypothetical protein